MRREQRESSYSCGMDDIEAIKKSFRQSSSESTSEMRASSQDRVWSLYTPHHDIVDMERRVQRGRSEERYPKEFRGRSISPSERSRARSQRATSAFPERFTQHEPRALSPIREPSPITRSTCLDQSSSEQTTQTTQTATAKKEEKAVERLPSYISKYLYPYYRPYYRLSPSELRAVLALARINADHYYTPRPDRYLTPRPFERLIPRRTPIETVKTSLPSPSMTCVTTTDHFTSTGSQFRSFYTYPNLSYTRRLLPKHYFM